MSGEIPRPSSTDTGSGFEVDLAWLAYDAQEWGNIAETMREASTAASGLNLTIQDFSIVGLMSGIIDSYQSLQGFMARLLEDAARDAENTKAALVKAASNYEEADKSGAQNIMKSYEGGI